MENVISEGNHYLTDNIRKTCHDFSAVAKASVTVDNCFGIKALAEYQYGIFFAISFQGVLTWYLLFYERNRKLFILIKGCKNGHHVTIWSYLKEEADEIREKRENPSKLPGVHIPEEIEITTDLQGSVEGKDVVVLAVPSMATRATAKKMCPYVKEEQILVNVAKGIEEGTLKTLSEQIEEEIPQANVAVLSGPSHAEEVSRGLPTTCVVSARKKETAEYLQGLFMSPVFRVYTTPDMLGVELGGALKNVIALAAGTADGLGYGDNTKAALITRGIAEMARLGVKMGAKLETFAGLSGIGDLIVTCASVHSRNRRAGYLMGQGYTMKQAMDEVQMVVEGVYSAKAAKALAEKYNVEMPIIMEVNKLLFENKPASEAVKDLMQREKQGEISWEL